MANVKITQLPSATTPLTGTEVFPLVQGTTTKQVAITGLFTSPVMTNPTLGTVGQADLINATGLPISTGVAGLGTGIATFLGTPSSTNLRAAVTDETGTGSLVFATSPTLVTPNLGTPSVLVATNATGTAVGLTAGSAITNANLTGAVTSVGNATSLGSFTSAQLRTALTDETGAGSAVFATSPTITAPILNQINDTNNAQILGLSPTTSAVDYLVVKNGTGVGVPLHFYADGSSANIGLHIQPKGTGLVTISDGTDFNKGIRFRSSSSAASAVTLLDAVSTAGRVVTLPDATTTLVGRDTTDTLTNKTIAFSSNTFSGTLAIANGGTNASTAASAIENLLPAYAGNGSKGLRLNSGATALEWVADGGGTVTSVGGTGTVNGITLTGTVTTSGNLTLGGTLSGVSLTSQVTGVLPTANGGTNLGGATPFTSGGVVYASSTSALATGSALQFDGTSLGIGGAADIFGRFYTRSVGITSNGTTALQMNGSTYSTIDMGAAGTRTFGITASATEAQIGSLTNIPLLFNINSATSLTLTSTSLYTASGINVGIGLSNPATYGKLVVSGGGFTQLATLALPATTGSTRSDFTRILDAAGSRSLDSGVASTGAWVQSRDKNDYSVNYDLFIQPNGGNVGLGTTTMTRNFNIGGSGAGVGLSINNTGTSGRSYSIISTNSGASVVGALGFFDDTAGAYRMILDSAGNLGLGVTPSAWQSTWRANQVLNASYAANNSQAYMNYNAYYNVGWKYIANGVATSYIQDNDGSHAWLKAGSGTAGNAISFTQAMTLDASGNLALGQTSASYRFDAYAASSTDVARFKSGQSSGAIYVQDSGGNGINIIGSSAYGHRIYTNAAEALLLGTNNTERARIDSSGNLLVGTTNATSTGGIGVKAKPNGQLFSVIDNTIGDTMDVYNTSVSAYRFYVSGAGTINATNTTITAISDQRLKENIRDLDDGLDVVLALKPRKFDWKEGKGQDIKNARGFIAQEFEAVLPDMIQEWKDPAPEGEQPYKAINANLIPTLVKAIQEQNQIIQLLQADVAALKGN